MEASELAGLTASFVPGSEIYVAFHKLEDRIAHTLGIRHEGVDRPLLSSLESSAEEAWPSSPPLQQLSVECLPNGRQAAFLVGMAGRSHWSLSISQGTHERGWLFDVACRVQQEPDWLGSSYRALTPLETTGLSAAVCAAEPRALRVCVEPLPEARATQLRIENRHLAVVQEWDIESLPTTVRWKYRVGPVQ